MRRDAISGICKSVLTLLAMLPALSAAGHELEENRATLVLRDQVHIAVTIYLNYPEALHLAIAPQTSMEEFLLATSSMAPEKFCAAVEQVQNRFVERIRIVGTGDQQLTLSNWHWPESAEAQAQLQNRVMQAIVAPGVHPAEEPLEIHADALAEREIHSVRISFPGEFEKVLVVAYRPTQEWVEGKQLSGEIEFH